MINDLDIKLRARNSSGDQTLYLTSDEDNFWFTLCGEHDGENIQIDFDDLTRSELEELRSQIDIILSVLP